MTLQLTAEQRTELVQLRQLFLGKQEGIARQKQEAMGLVEETQGVQPSYAGERVSSSHYIKVTPQPHTPACPLPSLRG